MAACYDSYRQHIYFFRGNCLYSGYLARLHSLHLILCFLVVLFSLKLLVTEFDFRTAKRRSHLNYTTSTMLQLGVVPILNENDAVSGNEGYEADGVFSDNDGLAALMAESVSAITSTPF